MIFLVTYEYGPCACDVKQVTVEAKTEKQARNIVKEKESRAMIIKVEKEEKKQK